MFPPPRAAAAIGDGGNGAGGSPRMQKAWRGDMRATSLLVVTLASLCLLSMFLRPVPSEPERGNFHVLSSTTDNQPYEQGQRQQQNVEKSQAGGLPPQQEQQCASARYEQMTCPTWDPTKVDGGDDVDYRVRWMHNHQHPQDCSAANYLIRSLTPHIGFGANVVLTVESTMYLAMYSKRIFLLDPDVPFRYAECPSRDWSCYFEPLSNCTIHDVEAIVAKQGGRYDQVVLDPSHRVIRTHRQMASIPSLSGWIWYRRTWEHPWWNDFFMFPGDEEVLAGALMYTMRPGLMVKDRVEQVLHEVLSQYCDFDPDRTISIPIRGSDKCMGSKLHLDGGMDGESECFDGLDKYMEMAEDIRRLDPKVNTIILTSEDDRYIQDRFRFEKDGRWRFIINKGDRVRGTGTIEVMEKRTETSMTDVFISFFSSLHLQMRGKYYILNCASNFHLVLRTLVKYGGCSYSRNPVVYCLNNQYADYKLCARERHRTCMNGKLEEIQIKNQAQGRNITLDMSSLDNYFEAD